MISSSSPDALVHRALQSLQSGQPEKALALCQGALRQTAHHLLAQKTAAVAYAMAQHYAEAASYCEQVLQQEGPSVEVLRNYANVLLSLGRSKEAVAEISSAIALDPRQALSHHTLGTFHARMLQWEPAVQAFREAIRCDTRFLPAHLALCQAMLDSKRFGESVLPIQDAIALFPDEAKLYMMMSHALARCGETEKARECLRVALARQPTYEPARFAQEELAPCWEAPQIGRRIALRRRREDDAGFLNTCYGDPEFSDRIARYFTKESDAFAWTMGLRREQSTHPLIFGALHWIVEDVRSGTAMGLAGISDLQRAHGRGEFFVGIFAKSQRGAGVALEASLLAMNFAFNVAGLHKLSSQVYDNNPHSQKSTLALGFSQESYLREHYRHPVSGQYFGMFGNGLLASDFRSNGRLARLSRRILGRDITVPVGGLTTQTNRTDPE